jgi:hypothetical protein
VWKTEYSAETSAAPAAVWGALHALHSGVALGENSDRFELHGPFAVGTELSVTPQGQDTMRSVITELVDSEVYADRTSFGGLTLLFRHTLQPLASGGTRITHQLEIDGGDADQVGPELGPQVSGDFPVAMGELVAAAERRVTAPAP